MDFKNIFIYLHITPSVRISEFADADVQLSGVDLVRFELENT